MGTIGGEMRGRSGIVAALLALVALVLLAACTSASEDAPPDPLATGSAVAETSPTDGPQPGATAAPPVATPAPESESRPPAPTEAPAPAADPDPDPAVAPDPPSDDTTAEPPAQIDTPNCDFPYDLTLPDRRRHAFEVLVLPCRYLTDTPPRPDAIEFRFLDDDSVRITRTLRDRPLRLREYGQPELQLVANVLLERSGDWQVVVLAEGREFTGPIYRSPAPTPINPRILIDPADAPAWVREAVVLPVTPAVIPEGMRALAEVRCLQCDSFGTGLAAFSVVDPSCTLSCFGLQRDPPARFGSDTTAIASPGGHAIAFSSCTTWCWSYEVEVEDPPPPLSQITLSTDGGVSWRVLDLPVALWRVESVADDGSAVFVRDGQRVAYPGLAPLPDLPAAATTLDFASLMGVTSDGAVWSCGRAPGTRRGALARDGEIVVELEEFSLECGAIAPSGDLMAVPVFAPTRERTLPGPYLLLLNTAGEIVESYTLDTRQPVAFWAFSGIRWESDERSWARFWAGAPLRTVLIDRAAGAALSYAALSEDGEITGMELATVISFGPQPVASPARLREGTPDCLYFNNRAPDENYQQCLNDLSVTLTGESYTDDSGTLWLFARGDDRWGWLDARFVE